METIIITLAHLAFLSEKIELEVMSIHSASERFISFIPFLRTLTETETVEAGKGKEKFDVLLTSRPRILAAATSLPGDGEMDQLGSFLDALNNVPLNLYNHNT